MPLDPQSEEDNEDDNLGRRSLTYGIDGEGVEGGVGGEGSVFSEGGLLDDVAAGLGVAPELALSPRGVELAQSQGLDNNKITGSGQGQGEDQGLNQGYQRPGGVVDQSWVSAGYDSQEESLEGTRYMTG